MTLAGRILLCSLLSAAIGSGVEAQTASHPQQPDQTQQTTPSASPQTDQTAPNQAKPDGSEAKPDQCAEPQQNTAPSQNPSPAPTAAPQSPAQQHTGSNGKPQASPAKPLKKHSKKKSGSASKSNSGPTRTVVRNGSTSDPALDLSPGVPQAEEEHQRQYANQLIAATNANLKTISTRTLNAKEQDLVNQIRMYQDQARKAVEDGDMLRGQNLGQKAYLLSKELLHP